MSTTAKTWDAPMPIGDATDVYVTVPAGAVPLGVPIEMLELREGPAGSLQIRRRATTDAACRPTRKAIEDENAVALRRHSAAAGARGLGGGNAR